MRCMIPCINRFNLQSGSYAGLIGRVCGRKRLYNTQLAAAMQRHAMLALLAAALCLASQLPACRGHAYLAVRCLLLSESRDVAQPGQFVPRGTDMASR